MAEKKGRPGFDYSIGVEEHSCLPDNVKSAIVDKNSFWKRYCKRVGLVLHGGGFDGSAMDPTYYGWEILVQELRSWDLSRPEKTLAWMPVWYFLLEDCK